MHLLFSPVSLRLPPSTIMALYRLTPTFQKLKDLYARLSRHRTAWVILYVTVVPLALLHGFVIAVWLSGPARAWDGTGHYGIAQIYDRSIFPDTFGWTHAHFGGMPFPNFYPPLFFWCVSLLHHTQLFSFDTSFKLLILLPTLLMPLALWLLAWTVSERNRSVTFWAALLGLIPLVSTRFGGHFRWSSGLDYFSTYAAGMYTQPLGFVLLLAWYVTYIKAHRKVWLFVLSCLLLALAVLGNYLNGLMAVLMVAGVFVFDLARYRSAASASDDERREARRALLAHFASPVISAALALFWLVPMFGTYEYFVTRPFTLIIITQGMLVWFVAAAIGMVCWLRRPTRLTAPYILTCLALAFVLMLAAGFAPRWYPLQANRLTPTLNFLLSVPVGYAVSTAFEKLREFLANRLPRVGRQTARLTPYVFVSSLVLFLAYLFAVSISANMRLVQSVIIPMSFYPASNGTSQQGATGAAGRPARSTDSTGDLPLVTQTEDLLALWRQEHQYDYEMSVAAEATLNDILRFAKEHRSGRYAVEVPDLYTLDLRAFDARALNSYLGAQGNQTLTVVFREASPSALFMYPQVNALSYNPENFGFSSALADDLDFAAQPIEKHLSRMSMLGARYLVIRSDGMKEQLTGREDISARYDFGDWSVFELRREPPPPAQVLPYRPALLVTGFTLKGRRNNELNYVRFAEEQFADDWYDVLLVRAPTPQLDDLSSMPELNLFGALILENYDCDRCDLVYRRIRDFAQRRPVILLAKDDLLFNRIRNSLRDFPLATVIERPEEGPGVWLDNLGPTRHYATSAARQVWSQIRHVLEEHKVPTGQATVSGVVDGDRIRIDYAPDGGASGSPAVPVLINTSYHPNWQRENGQPIYAASPTFMLTFLYGPTDITFERRAVDRFGLWASASTLALLLSLACWHYLSLFSRSRRRAVVAARVEPAGDIIR